MSANAQQPTGTIQALVEAAAGDRQRVEKELKEIQILIRQGGAEIERLAQRNTQLANKLRQMEANIESVPRPDIRSLYTAAQDAQMRLFMMRSQVEQLQARQRSLAEYGDLLRQIVEAREDGTAGAAGRKNTGPADYPSLIAQVVSAQEAERQRLARQIHDGPAQSLTNLILQAEVCERLFDVDPSQARGELAELKAAVNGTFRRVRDFIFELRPMMLDDLGLVPTLRRYVQEFGPSRSLAINFSLLGQERRLPAYTEVTIFRLIQRLLNDIHEHDQASHVKVLLDLREDTVRATVDDDGRGIDVNELTLPGASARTLAIKTFQDQVEMFGGKIEIHSSFNQGTHVLFEFAPA